MAAQGLLPAPPLQPAAPVQGAGSVAHGEPRPVLGEDGQLLYEYGATTVIIPVALRERKVHTLISMGLLVLGLFCLLPAWNMTWLLRSGVYLYFAGRGLPVALLLLLGVLLLWSLVPCYGVRLHREWSCCLPGSGCPAVTGCCLPWCPSMPPGCSPADAGAGCCLICCGPCCARMPPGIAAFLTRPWSKRSRSEIGFLAFAALAVFYLVVSSYVELPTILRGPSHVIGPDYFLDGKMPHSDVHVPRVTFPDHPNYLAGLPERVGWERVAYFIPDTIVWFYTLSATLPMILLVSMSAVLFFYVLTSSIFFAQIKPPPNLDGKLVDVAGGLFMVWASYAMVLGFILVILATPILWETKTAHDDLFQFCETSERTRDLFAHSQGLQALRQMKGCREQASVEDCPGYEPSVYVAVLRYMERDLKCSGFCYRKMTIPNPSEPSPQLPLSRTPLTLFSTENYEASCDGMAARFMVHAVGNAGMQAYVQGALLIVGTAVIGILKLSGALPGQTKELATDGDRVGRKTAETEKVISGAPTGYGAAMPQSPPMQAPMLPPGAVLQ